MKNLALAYSKAIADFTPVLKTATNPAFKSRYATLADVQDAIMPALAKHGLVLFQSVHSTIDHTGTTVIVGATMHHIESGEELSQQLSMRPMQATPQGIGSTITYARRYLLMTMFGLVGEDDDGAAGSTPPAPKVYQTQPKPPPDHEDPAKPRWQSSQQAVAWAHQQKKYDTLTQAQEAFAIFYKARVADPTTPTPAEKAEVFEAWYKLHTAP